jgi:cytochrome c oxidase cbb3-type subunit III
MSDFIGSGWALFIGIGTVVSLIACLVLLLVAARRRVMASDNSTGHVWDEDLREMNNPLPRWWMWLFVITVVFSLAYLVFYPGLGSYAGRLAWTSEGQLADETRRSVAALEPVYARFRAMDSAALVRDPVAMGIGERLFLNQCAACHGSDARGSKGFPDLTDADWLHPSTPESIKETIVKGRIGVMPPMGAAVGSAEDVRQLANYVLSLSGSAHDSVAANLGRSKFSTCAACHGATGKGNPALGAPNLSDKVWLHGWGEQAIVAIVNNGRTSVMPPQADRLTPDQVHVLAAYVLSLSSPKVASR